MCRKGDEGKRVAEVQCAVREGVHEDPNRTQQAKLNPRGKSGVGPVCVVCGRCAGVYLPKCR